MIYLVLLLSNQLSQCFTLINFYCVFANEIHFLLIQGVQSVLANFSDSSENALGLFHVIHDFAYLLLYLNILDV